MVETVIRDGLPNFRLEQIVGLDIERDAAEDLVDQGLAVWGPVYEVPPVVYVASEELEIGDWTFVEGAMLTVGCEISEEEAARLLRARHQGRAIVSAPGDAVG